MFNVYIILVEVFWECIIAFGLFSFAAFVLYFFVLFSFLIL